MIRKIFIATALATSLAFNPVTVAPAAADSDDVTKFLLGALAVGVVVHAIKKDRERDAARAAAMAAHAAAYRLPARCKFQTHTLHGPANVLGNRCLRREGVNTSALPNSCAFVINSHRGPRTVFGEYCLTQAGYTLAGRRR